MSEYTELLSCWHKLEHYTPAELPKSGIELLKEELLWEQDVRPGADNKTFVYTVYLGAFTLEHVVQFVRKYFKDTSYSPRFSGSAGTDIYLYQSNVGCKART